MIELYQAVGKEIPEFSFYAGENPTVTNLAKVIRGFLDLSIEKQLRFRNSNTAFNYYVSKLESGGVLLFQSDDIETSEMRGLSVYFKQFPIIIVNRKDEYSARIFTIFHELVHIMTRTSGICNIMNSIEMPNEKAIESFCNQVAASALVPDDNLLTSQYFTHMQIYGWDENYIRLIAKDFAVSRDVIIGRLFNLDYVTKDFYIRELNRYTDEYKKYQAFKRLKNKKGFLPPALDVGTQVGKFYARTVLAAYNQETISPKTASNYLLNLREQHFSKVERWCF
jgi:Zn-dependent peptidase ImmA (M78 family)